MFITIQAQKIITKVLAILAATSKAQKIIIAVLAILLIGSASLAYYFSDQLQTVKNNPKKFTQEETKSLVAKVGQLMVLPAGEDPIIATVVDPERLKDQAFFAQAKKGDRVLIYSKAQKAILYDPVANKIVEVAPTNIGAAPAPAAP